MDRAWSLLDLKKKIMESKFTGFHCIENIQVSLTNSHGRQREWNYHCDMLRQISLDGYLSVDSGSWLLVRISGAKHQ